MVNKMNIWFGFTIILIWFSSMILCLDYANRTGNVSFNFIALAIFILTVVGILKDESADK